MSKHRVKNIAVDDDYDDDYDEDFDEYDGKVGANAYNEGSGITPEDMEKLRIGTVQVRNALDQSLSSTGDKEIQDALWHYYYDTSKTINYLKSAACRSGS
jgi:elongation factor 1 alpha-like protein